MSASILDAIQGLATPAMIQSATSTLGISDTAATTALGAASTSILGGLLQNSGNASIMTKVAELAAGHAPDANMFANVTGMLTGGLPTSGAHLMGNRLLGLVFGDKTSAMMAAVGAATGVNAKAASGLTTLAAPMVLGALRSKLGAAPTAAGLTNMLNADRSIITAAMPPALRSVYGLATAMPPAAVAAAAVPAAAAAVAAKVAPMPAAPAAQTASGHATTPIAAPAAAAAPMAAAAPVAAAAAPMVAAAAKPVVAAPAIAATVAPTAPTAPAAAPMKPAAAVAPVAPAPAAAPKKPAVAAAPMAAPVEAGGVSRIGAWLGLAIPLLLLTGLIWYWAYGIDGGKSALTAAKTVAAPVLEAKKAEPAPAPKPAPAPEAKKPEPAPAPEAKKPELAPAPEPKKAEAASAPVAVPGANGLVKYTLPGGAVIEVAKDGLESKLLAFVSNKDAAIDNKLWFDFDRLSFVTASSDVTPESKAQIAAAVAILKAYPAVQVKIGGYTDNQGDPEANLKLSDSRAKRVAEELVAGGIAADRVESKGYGDQFPIGDNATPEGRAKNRRTALSVRQK
jgi:outer membrane protein OmpA-like peptidoglycan-associated protein